MKAVRVGLLGFGVVGGGAVAVLTRNANEIARRAGRGIEIVKILTRDPGKRRAQAVPEGLITTDATTILDDPTIEVVVETMGGIEPARSYVLAAIAKGKHVVTANKALIATAGNEIFAAARARGVVVAFEAAVAGGIPIIKAIREGLAGNRIRGVAGIINGTCNYILTEMREHGTEFATALVQAQELGYAEADPHFDVDGIDAAHKLTILAAIAFGIPLAFAQVHIEGIRDLEPADIAYAAELGYRVKHLGIARRVSDGIELRVHPVLIPQKRLIANVDGVMNAILVSGDAVGSTLFYGPGAGAEPTGSAVVADIIDVVRTLTTDPELRVPHLAFQPDALSDGPILGMADVTTACYLRCEAEDRPGVLADITRILADLGISIEAILQKAPEPSAHTVPVILLTHGVREAQIDEAIARIAALPAVTGKIRRLRVESFA
ncbi:homoserine dehydrogenase [Acidiferrobacter sp.]|uniref:homoserine dehydrogenase n=1 Tax=Acidiferrobacter sp. TaxID=1872107 RepID=UPI002614CA43|nr:homoserine dehydrogenase [Acidiferrobacter sp.]